MANTFSFSGSVFLNIVKRIPNMVPGIQKVVGIYFDPDSNAMSGNSIDLTLHPGEQFAIFNPGITLDHPQRKSSAMYNWMLPQEVDSEDHAKKKSQLNVFDEFDNNILLLRYKNMYDGLNDLVYIYFDKTGVGLRNSQGVITADNRNLIGHLLYHCIRDVIQTAHKDAGVFKSFRQISRTGLMEKEELSKKLEEKTVQFGLSLVDLCTYHLEEITKNNYGKYEFSESAREKIKTYNGELKHLYGFIENAVSFAENMFFDMNLEHFTIEASHLDFTPPQNLFEPEKQSTMVPEKHFKTIFLLDRLETAAQRAINEGLEITGENVGARCSRPISAPAITDAIHNKHATRIMVLLNKHPEKWPVIRSRFKPLKNLIEKNKNRNLMVN